MGLSTGLKTLGLSLGLALTLAMPMATSAQAAPVGSALAYRDAAALPIENVQVRRPVRRPVRNVRRNNNGAAVAGALIGAAIIGGALIANSQPRRPRAQYYYTDDGYPVEYYGAPYYQAAPVYHPQQVYRPQPYYGAPEPYYRAPRAPRVAPVIDRGFAPPPSGVYPPQAYRPNRWQQQRNVNRWTRGQNPDANMSR